MGGDGLRINSVAGVENIRVGAHWQIYQSHTAANFFQLDVANHTLLTNPVFMIWKIACTVPVVHQADSLAVDITCSTAEARIGSAYCCIKVGSIIYPL